MHQLPWLGWHGKGSMPFINLSHVRKKGIYIFNGMRLLADE